MACDGLRTDDSARLSTYNERRMNERALRKSDKVCPTPYRSCRLYDIDSCTDAIGWGQSDIPRNIVDRTRNRTCIAFGHGYSGRFLPLTGDRRFDSTRRQRKKAS